MVLISFVVALLALVLAVAALLAGRRPRRPAQADAPAGRPRGLVPTAPDPQAVRHVAVVRYDAFADLGGQLSYSVALLDAAGDGVVLSAVNGRRDGRCYAKGVLDGTGEQALTPEERQAIDVALGRAAT